MNALVRLIKWLIITAVALVVLAVAGYFSYSLYSDAQANKALTERTNHSDWRWQKDRGPGKRRSSDVQWRSNEDGAYLMRRVYDDHRVIAFLTKTGDGAMDIYVGAHWLVDCEEGTSIKTSVTVKSGEHLHLECESKEWGNELTTAVVADEVDVNNLPRWSKNFDGFEVDEDFDSYEWDFQPAVRHLTLQSAKPTEETE
jgi:hypothetical protein